MRAIVRQGYGGTEELVIQKLPVPEPKSGEIVIQVKAFGLNHAETYMRRREGERHRMRWPCEGRLGEPIPRGTEGRGIDGRHGTHY